MDLNLKNKVIIVTGGSRGIGNGICTLLAAEGAIPVIIGKNVERILKAVETIKSNNGKAFCAFAQLADFTQCKKAVQKVVDEYGRIDGLVNNAGVNDGVGLEKGNYEDFVQSLHKNAVHYYTMAHLSLPYLKKSAGPIVNIGSKVAETGQGSTSGYAAANGARNALVREWAVELLPYGIRVNSVIVSESMTPLYEKWLNKHTNPEAMRVSIEGKIPLGNRMTTPAEIANMVAFLLSERSSHTTGQLIYVDGGYRHLDRAITK